MSELVICDGAVAVDTNKFVQHGILRQGTQPCALRHSFNAKESSQRRCLLAAYLVFGSLPLVWNVAMYI
jgi:hypothetical protein